MGMPYAIKSQSRTQAVIDGKPIKTTIGAALSGLWLNHRTGNRLLSKVAYLSMNRIRNILPHLLPHRLRAILFYWLWLPGLVLGSGQLVDAVGGLRRLHPSPFLITTAQAIFALGLGLICLADYDLRHRGLGTASPAMPTRRLVTAGSYRLCRHPMFLGYDLAAFAIIFMTGSMATIVVSFPIFLLWQGRFLHREELLLASRFGEDYHRYRHKVPLLIPFLPPRRR